MEEVLRREREIHLATWETSLVALGSFLGISREVNIDIVLALKRELRKFVNHATFSSEQTLRNVRAKLASLERDRQMMRRLEEL